MNHIRFIAVIADPGRIWTDYEVIDTHKKIVVCTCSESGLAESVAGCLNLQWITKGGDKPVALLGPTFDELDEVVNKK